MLASGETVVAVAAIIGLGAGVLASWGRGKGKADVGAPCITINFRDFALCSSTASIIVFEYIGSDPQWRGARLRLKTESPDGCVLDAKATQVLAGRFAEACQIVSVRAADVRGLAMSASGAGEDEVAAKLIELARKGDPVPCLRTLGAHLEPEAREGSEITLSLKPGVGLLDLYGRPGLYAIQSDSLLRKGSDGRRGMFSPQDFYSGRAQFARRALMTLVENPGDILTAAADGKQSFPECGSTSAHGEQHVSVQELLQILACSVENEGKFMIAALLRAQCGAQGGVPASVRQLRDVLQEKNSEVESQPSPAKEDVEAAFARGFWNLPADSSGMHAREREAERLLERARRELWTEGSNSRRELELQMHQFLLRHKVGLAASEPCLVLRAVRPIGPNAEETLRQAGFERAASTNGQGLWAKLELVTLDIPIV